MGNNTTSYDKNLNPVLETASDEDLQFLVDLILNKMSNYLDINEAYKKYRPRHSMYADVIAQEIRCYGGNSFANLFRGGEGPSYSEIVSDVATKLKINTSQCQYLDEIEDAILMYILKKSIEQMSEHERNEILNELGENGNISKLTADGTVMALMGIFKLGGFKSYQLSVIIVNAVAKAILGRGLSFAGNCLLTKTLSIVTGPIGWVIGGIWTAIDIASPSFKVTMPAVIYVAMLRKKQKLGL